ncbi:MAG TPA: hypothetical protein VHQ70_00725 [Syntrophomonadaceae bacterium]|nr:hypothetical protein [Syntrophomonadaceae bacterium]
MQTQRRYYACGRNMVLGALYDAFEKLNWKLISANSDAGILIAADRKTNTSLLIRVNTEQADLAEVTVELASAVFAGGNLAEKESVRLLETLTQIIEYALRSSKNTAEVQTSSNLIIFERSSRNENVI